MQWYRNEPTPCLRGAVDHSAEAYQRNRWAERSSQQMERVVEGKDEGSMGSARSVWCLAKGAGEEEGEFLLNFLSHTS